MEKRNSQLEHRQPIEQKRDLFCTCDSGEARCQSQPQYHLWRRSSMFEAYCVLLRSVLHGQVSLATINQILRNS